MSLASEDLFTLVLTEFLLDGNEEVLSDVFFLSMNTDRALIHLRGCVTGRDPAMMGAGKGG